MDEAPILRRTQNIHLQGARAAALLALALLFLIFVILCQAEADAEARDGERADPPPATVRGGAGTVNEGGRGPVPPAATAG